jgi:aerobic-type carbon monoxide dehydrogenase small subunit (CoxS/CutS family)
VSVIDDGAQLLEVLRDRLGMRTPKDGCSPQGQCGCCTVWVDGSPRVACVTPTRRVQGREITTLDGLDPSLRRTWAEAFTDAGASQCGFCTPGIIMRLASLAERKPGAGEPEVATSLAAHLCRCTGWRTIFDAFSTAQPGLKQDAESGNASRPVRNLDAAARRAEIEGRCQQLAGPVVALGLGGFADDRAPLDALVAVRDGSGGWAVAETLTEARRLSGKVQGRNSGSRVSWPLEVPDDEWALALQTTFVEPAYLEPDASWCEPGGEPSSPVANGGAFGGKLHSLVTEAARSLSTEHRRPVRVLLSREDVVRLGPKRPPIAAGLRGDGTGLVRVGRTPGSGDLFDWVETFKSHARHCEVEIVDIAGPPVSADIRGAGWVEGFVLMAGIGALEAGPLEVVATAPEGGRAGVVIRSEGVHVVVDAGDVLDEVVLRSYCLGAVHQALGWVRREAVAVDASGEVLDLTIRSFGIIPAREMPDVTIEVSQTGAPPVNGSDAVFAATAAAAWIAQGLQPRWPLER